MIWVVDMYRAVIEHPEWIPQAWQQQIDLRAGSDRGRIYRIMPTESARTARWPNISKLSAQELVALLENGSGTLRDMVQQELLHRGDKSIVGHLRQLSQSSVSPQARVHALWTLNGLDVLRETELRMALDDKHPAVVRNAILLAEPRIGESDALLQALCQLVDMPDAKAKLQLALSLGESNAPAAGAALGKLVPHVVDDPWLAHAIVSSSKHHSLVVLEQFLSLLRDGDADASAKTRLESTIADLIATTKAAGSDPSELVTRAIATAKPDASWIYPLAGACATATENDTNLDSESRQAILAVYQRATSLAGNVDASAALRSQALQLFARSLGDADEERAQLGELLSPSTPLEVQTAALDRLMAFHDRQSAEQLLSHWATLSHSVRDTAAMQLISSSEMTDVLLDQLESGAIRPDDLSPAARQTLRQSGSQSMKARINRLLGKTAAANQELVQRYLQYQQDESTAADIARGQELFRKHCAMCHVPDAAGFAAGPNLSNLTDRSRGALTEAILVPNRALEPQYRGYLAVLADGRVLSGAIAAEAGDAITLALADGKRVTIQRSEIDEFRDTGISLMPEGIQQELDPGMLRDLVEYLRSETFAQTSRSP
jgi:putative heme-binding domain-containing protein